MKRPKKLVLAAILVLVLVVGGGAWWYLNDDAPPAVALADAVASVTETTAAEETAGPAGGIEGVWSVDAETGEFDYERATGSFVGFRIGEELASIGRTEAVGRTGAVTGSIEVSGTTLTAATIEADLTAITTNESRRDDKVQQALETDRHPTASFVLTSPVELGVDAGDGGGVVVTATGDLTVHGVTRTVQLPLEAQLVDGTVVAVGSLDVTFSDYGVAAPSSPLVVSADDHGVIELQLLFTKA